MRFLQCTSRRPPISFWRGEQADLVLVVLRAPVPALFNSWARATHPGIESSVKGPTAKLNMPIVR